MHVVIIPGAYPDEQKAHKGIFFKQQAFALKDAFQANIKVGIIAPDLRSLLSIKKASEIFRFGLTYRQDETDIPVYRKYSFNLLPGLWHFNRYIFSKHAEGLFEAYCSEHGKPDIIHAHIGLWAGYAAMKISQKHNIPYIITEHSSHVLSRKLNKWQKKCIIKAYNTANGLAAVSSGLKSEMQLLSPKKDVVVVPNMVDISLFSIPTQKRDAYRLVSVGNLLPVKGYDILIKAFALCKQQEPLLKLSIAGSGPEMPGLQKLANSLKISDSIHWAGKLKPEEINSFLHSGGIYVSPSRFETFGLSIAEAMATGMPAVVTDSGGPQDFVAPFNGISCKKEDPAQLSQAILYLIKHYDTFHAETIREFILKGFSGLAVSEKNMSLYTSSSSK